MLKYRAVAQCASYTFIVFGAWPPTAKYQPTFMPIDLVQRDTNIQTYRESVGDYSAVLEGEFWNCPMTVTLREET